MKRLAALGLLLALIPLQAEALDTSELFGLVAMPLAVAAVSEATGVPATELSQVVAALNQADVPPTQFVQVVRYVPVVSENERPRFVQFVRGEVENGVTGTRLVEVIGTRLQTYEVTPQFVALQEPATTYVISDRYLVTAPSAAFSSNDLLALIAMPLAVNAVADVTGISVAELGSFVGTLNAANVEPVRVIEVLRYVPVALVAETDDDFVRFVRTEFDRGTTGDALVTVIADRLRDYDVRPQIATAPSRVVVVDGQYIPPVVVTRVAERRSHPHGGPPGQLKKERGLKTGAEVVHGSVRKPKREKFDRADRTVRIDRDRRIDRERRIDRPERGGAEVRDNRGQGKPNRGEGNQGKGKEKGKG